MRNSAVLVVSLLVLGGSFGCARRVRVETTPATVVVAQPAPQYFQPPPTTVLFAEPRHPQTVRGGVIQALTELGYRLEGEDGQRIVAFYNRGRESLRIQIEYWPTQVTVTYLGSTGLRFRRDGTSPEYERWMANLQREIPRQVAWFARQRPQAAPVIVVQQPASSVSAGAVVVQPSAPPPATGTVVVQPSAPPPATGTVVVQPAPAASATVQGTVVIGP